MIEVKDLHKSFGDAHILKGITTSFEKGKTNLIIGQSGSGKTVFLKCLLGLFEFEQGPMIGYIPGHMPYKYGEKLNNLGVTIINEEADNTVHKDRKLITGASPLAANDFGKLAATELLKEVNK